jgi:hypothetical protein
MVQARKMIRELRSLGYRVELLPHELSDSCKFKPLQWNRRSQSSGYRES